MKILRIIAAVVADIATLGGAVNDGYFANGRCTYTTAAIRRMKGKKHGKP